MYKWLKTACLSSMILGLNACSTILVTEWAKNGEQRIQSEEKLIFADQIISYGVPKTQLAGFANVIALAGERQSYLVQPQKNARVQPKILVDIYQQIDLNHVVFRLQPSQDAASATDEPQEINLQSLQTLEFHQYQADRPLKQTLQFIFIKPIAELKVKEQQTLEALNFHCQQQYTGLGTSGEQLLLCKQNIPVEFTIVSRAGNTDQLKDRFRQPVAFKLYATTSVRSGVNARQIVAVPLYPVAVAFDIVTSPIQGLGLYWLSKNLKIGF